MEKWLFLNKMRLIRVVLSWACGTGVLTVPTLVLFLGTVVVRDVSGVQSLNGCGSICGKAKPPFSSGSPPHAERVVRAKSGNEDDEEFYPDYDAEPSQESGTGKTKKKSKNGTKKNKRGSSISDADNRIVNGYSPDDRPWLVLLDAGGASCGGTIINTR